MSSISCMNPAPMVAALRDVADKIEGGEFLMVSGGLTLNMDSIHEEPRFLRISSDLVLRYKERPDE